VISVDEIDVGVSGRTEENCVAGGASGGGMGGGIVFSEVCFDLDDSAGEKFFALTADEDFPEKFPAYLPRIAVVETAGKDSSVFVK
jgi:hypothetical protein